MLLGIVALLVLIGLQQALDDIGHPGYQVVLHRPSTWRGFGLGEVIMTSRLTLLLSLGLLIGGLLLWRVRATRSAGPSGAVAGVVLAAAALGVAGQRMANWVDDGDSTCGALYRPGIWRNGGWCQDLMVTRGLTVAALVVVAGLSVALAVRWRGRPAQLPAWPGALAACSLAVVLVGTQGLAIGEPAQHCPDEPPTATTGTPPPTTLPAVLPTMPDGHVVAPPSIGPPMTGLADYCAFFGQHDD